MKYRILAAMFLFLALGCAATTVRAQQQPQTFFKQQAGLSDSDIQSIQSGQVMTKVLIPVDKKYGILVFGAVYVKGTTDQFAAAVRNVKGLMQNKVYLDVQEFSVNGAPPQPSDFDRVTFSRTDVDALRNCQPGDCDLQVFNVENFKKQIDWNSGDRYNQANQLARKMIYEGIMKYMSGGLRSLGSYSDRRKPLSLYQATKDMIGGSYYLPADKSGGIYQDVVNYPQDKLAGSDDFFYWANLNFGEGPVIQVNHVSLFPKGVGVVKFVVASEQLYASRYIRVALQMFYCVPDTSNPKQPGFYLIEMNDSRMPDFSGLKLVVVRKVATGKAQDATRDMLSLYSGWINK
jgi:hypothetical protein